MAVYRTSGNLTGTITDENFIAASRYLHFDYDGKPLNMHRYLDPPLEGVVQHLEWMLTSGSTYTITAVTSRDLTEDELKQLSSECSGQNSDGLGEGFEQQDFAWDEDVEEETDCYDCQGTGRYDTDPDDEEAGDDCPTCDGAGYFPEEDNGRMISFDWETNELPWTKIA